MESTAELTSIATVAVAATFCGLVMTRLRQPPIVGFILAGIVLGPSGLGLVANREQVGALAGLGVLMLLYFIGMELSLRVFRRIWRIAVFATLMQIGVSVAAMMGLMQFLGWPLSHAVLFGFVLALSSTAVAIKMLEDIGEARGRVGRITVGVLIAQDLAVAPMLLIIGSMAGNGFDETVPIKVLVSIGLLIAIIRFFSRRRKISLPLANLLTRRTELLPLASLTWCFGFAAIGGLVGLSAPYGAFLAGLLVGNSAQRQAFFHTAEPIQNVLLMVFFLSIGLLIDLGFLWDNLGIVLLLWLFITVFKTALNAGALRLMGESWQRAFLSSLVLAQIGEFSFVLGAAALDHAIIGTEIHRLIVAVTVISLVTSPLWMDGARRLRHRSAGRIDSLGRMFRLIYFREVRLARRTGRHGIQLCLRMTEGGRQGLGRLRRSGRRAEAGTATPAMPQEQTEVEQPDGSAAAAERDAEPEPTSKGAKLSEQRADA